MGYEHRKKIGDLGEKLAERYLKNKGYDILGKKVQTGHQELDIIAKYKDKLLVFVEVKTRTTYFGEAEESVYNRKLKKLKLAIMKYLSINNIKSPYFRLDLISIFIDKNIAKIKHYKDIF